MNPAICVLPVSLQSDIGVSGAEKSALEQQISSLQLANERQERQGKQESMRLQAEMQSLRQRLDRADGDLIHSRRENIRLTEQVAALEKEVIQIVYRKFLIILKTLYKLTFYSLRIAMG